MTNPTAVKASLPKKSGDTLSFVGVDDGHFGTKICLEDGTCHYMPSRAVIGLQPVVSLDGTEQSNAYEIDGEHYTVIEDQVLIPAADTRHLKPLYAIHPLNRAIVHHMLQKFGFGGRRVAIATGLPMDNYYMAGATLNEELIAAKKAHLLNPNIQNLNPNVKLARIERHNVLAEGIAAWFDLALDFNGNENPETVEMVADRALAIVDIGGKTTDIAMVMEGGQGLYPERSGTRAVGVLNFYEAVGARLKDRFQLNDAPPAKHIEEAIRTKQYKLFGKPHDVSSAVDGEAKMIAQQIKSMMNKLIGSGSDIGHVVFVGGGAILLRDYLEAEYPNQAIFPANPEFANARGLVKAAKHLLDSEA